MKHTPGPWKIIARTTNGRNLDGSEQSHDETEIVYDKNYGGPFGSICQMTGNNNEANAQLVAAAPELYDLLDEINAAFYTRTTKKQWIALMGKTKPLLQKARGEKCLK